MTVTLRDMLKWKVMCPKNNGLPAIDWDFVALGEQPTLQILDFTCKTSLKNNG